MIETRRAILVVDDEPAQRRLLGGCVQRLGFQTLEAASGEEALQTLQTTTPAMVLLDMRLPGISGMETLAAIRRSTTELPVLLVTAYADLREAVSAVKIGADDYLSKPIDLDELETVIADMLGAAELAEPAKTRLPLPAGVLAESPAMRRLLDTLAVVAPSDAPVLVLGESGVGKEVVAQLIHRWSPRAEGPLITANCAGLPETLVESELFGHVKGAFTGASQARLGFFRAAHGGTLLLDEIGELPLALQPKLLRALESREILPVGCDTPVACDVRLVAATNRDLGEAVREGKFREDLYYRINVMELLVPRLTERSEDILPLARQFAAEFAHAAVRLSPQAVECLMSHAWPGNVRELRNAIQRACLLCRGDVILPEHLPPKIASLTENASPAPAGRLSQMERSTILATLAECKGNRTQAARKLGISRRTLIYKIHAIERPD